MLKESVGGHVFEITKWAACITVGLLNWMHSTHKRLKASSGVLKRNFAHTKPLAAIVNTDQMYTRLNYTYARLTPTLKISLNPQHYTQSFTTYFQNYNVELRCKQHMTTILMRDGCSDNGDTELHHEIIPNQYTNDRKLESEKPCKWPPRSTWLFCSGLTDTAFLTAVYMTQSSDIRNSIKIQNVIKLKPSFGIISMSNRSAVTFDDYNHLV